MQPLVMHYDTGKTTCAVYKLSDYTDDIAKTSIKYERGATPSYFKKMVKNIISEEFLDLE